MNTYPNSTVSNFLLVSLQTEALEELYDNSAELFTVDYCNCKRKVHV